MARDFTRMTEGELAELDASLGRGDGRWWNGFYQDRAKPCPFFVASPDESLAQWMREGIVRPGRAIDLGCGHGRNAVFLAQQGFAVEAVDYSQAAIDWARERVAKAGVPVTLIQRNVFELELEPVAYDLVYDSGCFHHMPPHRRAQYVRLVVNALKPGGFFGLTCFRPEGGSDFNDDEVYERGSLGGGLGYTEERLREIWSAGLDVRIVRQMDKPAADSGLFGEPFLWALLAQKA